MRYHLLDENNEIITSNLEEQCKVCLVNCQSISSVKEYCSILQARTRLGIIKNTKGQAFFCSNETKTTKLFREKIEIIAYALTDFKKIKSNLRKEIAQNEQQRVQRLVHNLVSINAHNIQEIYDLVPQELLTSNLQEQISIIKKEINENPDAAAHTFLRIAKHNIQMKSEFSIYKKLFKDKPILDFRFHPIKKVILNILHTFFTDFSEKGVVVKVSNYVGNVKLDYETVSVAFYHLIENASKYILPNSVLFINIFDNNSKVIVEFVMESIYIEADETDKIFEEGYSGLNVKRLGKQGEGIGMSRIKRLVELNNSKFYLRRGSYPIYHHGLKFANNTFIIEFNE